MSLNPKLASHAAIDNKIIVICGIYIDVAYDINGIRSNNVNIIPSKQNKDISRWLI